MATTYVKNPPEIAKNQTYAIAALTGAAAAMLVPGLATTIAGTTAKLTAQAVASKAVAAWIGGFLKGCFEKYDIKVKEGDKIFIKDGYLWINGEKTSIKLTKEQIKEINDKLDD